MSTRASMLSLICRLIFLTIDSQQSAIRIPVPRFQLLWDFCPPQTVENSKTSRNIEYNVRIL